MLTGHYKFSVAASRLGNVETSNGDCQATRLHWRGLVHSPKGIHVPLNGCVRFAPSSFPSLQAEGKMSNFVTCPCQYCDERIEFDAELFQPEQATPCPHCGLDTVLFLPRMEAKKLSNSPKTRVKFPAIKPLYLKALFAATALIVIAWMLLWGNPGDSGNIIEGLFQLIGFLLVFVAALGLYFLPFIMARKKNKKNSEAIGVLNFFLGWTVVGWVIALVWATMED
jgi:T4 superinfection immunity protein